MPKDEWLKLAILYDKDAKYSPSNQEAVYKFCETAIRHRIYPTLLTSNDIDSLPDFDGLFIRDTTHPSDYTYAFATYARMLGKKVIDNPTAIEQGCNKIWQASQFDKFNIPHPITQFVSYDNSCIDAIEFPCVLKIPDSCFSQGVYKCKNKVEYADTLYKLKKYPTLVCQEFIETTYDWRIAIFNHKFLFAIKYYMVDNDWKIIKYDRKGDYIDGRHECVSFENIPTNILKVASKCDKFLTDGLYGIDIKEKDGNVYVIEINDNPSIDAGVEDEIEEDKIYNSIMGYFRDSSAYG